MGFSYNEILAMSRARLDSLLPSRAQREAANLLRRRASVYVTNVAGSYNRNFHEDSEMVAGDWYSDNDGQYKEDQVEYFAEEAYGESGAKTAYHFFGEITSFGTHQGVDMNLSEGSEVYSAHSGKVVFVGGDYGHVSIYNASDGVTYQYAHMKSIKVVKNQTISAGTLLGLQSNKGVGGSHLHFEVRSGSKTGMGPNKDNRIHSLSPYDYM